MSQVQILLPLGFYINQVEPLESRKKKNWQIRSFLVTSTEPCLTVHFLLSTKICRQLFLQILLQSFVRKHLHASYANQRFAFVLHRFAKQNERKTMHRMQIKDLQRIVLHCFAPTVHYGALNLLTSTSTSTNLRFVLVLVLVRRFDCKPKHQDLYLRSYANL